MVAGHGQVPWGLLDSGDPMLIAHSCGRRGDCADGSESGAPRLPALTRRCGAAGGAPSEAALGGGRCSLGGSRGAPSLRSRLGSGRASRAAGRSRDSTILRIGGRHGVHGARSLIMDVTDEVRRQVRPVLLAIDAPRHGAVPASTRAELLRGPASEHGTDPITAAVAAAPDIPQSSSQTRSARRRVRGPCAEHADSARTAVSPA
jgi:hypothetical protein